ncbi:UNVERIFIED_CONTAM: hypothetical protein PYX00_002681 [Menopon gallinae]|uniref:Reverse transcriptase domain-containing protein n=1 Tax=Menopon gallinae TaxID=328185 RepID=A0AAW2HYR5_9NEOP
MRGNESKKVARHVQKLLRNKQIHSKYEVGNRKLLEYKDTLTQKLSVLSERLRRFKEAAKRREHNAQFSKNPKGFYRSLNPASQGEPTKPPHPTEMHAFWSNIWSRRVEHNRQAPWIAEFQEKLEDTPLMAFEEIATDLAEAIRKTHNWKAPGPDRIRNFWLKKFSVAHPFLARHFTKFIRDPVTTPEFLTEGVTFMLPKDSGACDPSKFRPITCLCTLYKALTSCLTAKIYEHCDSNNLVAEEQKGCRKRSRGCKEQVLIDSVILEQAKRNRRSLCTAFIDYKKTFDSVPHSWLLETLVAHKIHPTIVQFLGHVISTWRTKLSLNHRSSTVTTEYVPIRRGIFQGDSLSPLWFCLALNPLSHILNSSEIGFSIRNRKENLYTVSHLLYMDDIKLYAPSQKKLERLIVLTECFSKDIGMSFGIDKCRNQCIRSGVLQPGDIALTDGDVIPHLEDGDAYKYLGFQQSRRIEHGKIKDQLATKYTQRLNSILKSRLNGKNIVTAINTFAVPVLAYSFGIINWTKGDLYKLKTKTHKILTHHRIHHPRSAVERLTIPRKAGGRGLIDITNLHNKAVRNLREFFKTKSEVSPLHKAVCTSDINYTPLDLGSDAPAELPIACPAEKIRQWQQKSLHGRYIAELDREHIDKEASHAWLGTSGLFPETEGFVCAIMDQVIATKNYLKFIVKDGTQDDRCRRCLQAPETIQHVIGSCPKLSQTDYKHRHDQVAKIVHQKLALKYGLLSEQKPYYKYRPETVLENETHKLLWDRAILTDKTTPCNRPDITLVDKAAKTTLLIDIAVPNTHNLQQAHQEKLSKYVELAEGLRKQWRMNSVRVVPIILSTLGAVPKTLHISLEALRLPYGTFLQLQKAAVINTCHIARKFLNLPAHNA